MNGSGNSRPTDSFIVRQGFLRRILARVRSRKDSEHETMLNRVVIYSIINVYAIISDLFKDAPAEKLLPEIGPYSLVFGFLTFAAFVHMLYRPDECAPRKIAVMALDTLCVTYAIYLGDEHLLWMYPILLWISLGNGFRFGIKYLIVGAILTVSSFAVLIQFSPFWLRYPALAWGCLAGLVIIPAYVSVLIKKLSEAKRQAEESNRAKSAFLASISHELRTPLTAIIGLSDLLRETTLTREQADMNKTIGESGRSLLSLINSILDLSRLEAGKMPKKEQIVDLYRLMHRITDMISVPARAKNVRVSLNLSPDLPRFINTYLKHIEDAIVNLTSNAVKFTENGYVLVHVRTTYSDARNVRIRFEVSDSGIGIAQEAQSRIFERFTQADESIVDKFGGTGLGLATVKQMIEDIGGAVGVTSKLGAGSTFWFEIDAVQADHDRIDDWAALPLIVVADDLKLLQYLDDLEVGYTKTVALQEAQTIARNVRMRERVSPVILIDTRITGSDLNKVAHDFESESSDHPPRLIAIIDALQEAESDIPHRNYVTALQRPFDAEILSNALVKAAGPREEFSSPRDAGTSESKRAQFKILLADDNKVNRTVIGKILTQAGHTVMTVENGRLALEAMQEEDFDIALFDLNMPVLNGIDASKLYQFASLGQDAIPIIALTADATPEAEARCREAGMLGCLTKPVDSHLLFATMESIVFERRKKLGISERGAEVESTELATSQADLDAPMSSINLENEIIDTRSIEDLRELGGDEFVQQVFEHFVSEAHEVLTKLDIAVAEQDYKAFREQVHALRSGAANVGAKRVFKLCLQWREITLEDVINKGDGLLIELGDALTECSEKIAAYCRKSNYDTIAAATAQYGTGRNFESEEARKAS